MPMELVIRVWAMTVACTDAREIWAHAERFRELAMAKAKAPVDRDPADESLSSAKDLDVDMIVMGSRGLGRFSQVFMGSVSTKVCNHALCTGITVK